MSAPLEYSLASFPNQQIFFSCTIRCSERERSLASDASHRYGTGIEFEIRFFPFFSLCTQLSQDAFLSYLTFSPRAYPTTVCKVILDTISISFQSHPRAYRALHCKSSDNKIRVGNVKGITLSLHWRFFSFLHDRRACPSRRFDISHNP